jgi:hypothetical protein
MPAIGNMRKTAPNVGTTGTQSPVETKPTPAAAQTAAPQAAHKNALVDGFENAASKVKGAAAKLFGKPDKVFDGVMVGAGGKTFPAGTPLNQVPGVTPRNNPNPSETLVYVNGIQNDKDTQFGSMQQIADRTGAKVVGIHNATEGIVADLAQCVTDKLDKGKNPAVDTLADTVYNELKAGRDVHLVAHSQGALVTSRALNDVAKRLRIEDGLSAADVEKKMSGLKVETFGGAAAHFPDGPQYVHYVNNRDIVPTWFGQGNGKGVDEWARDGGKGAVIRRFDYGSGISGSHSLNDAYLPQRLPFDQARAAK